MEEVNYLEIKNGSTLYKNYKIKLHNLRQDQKDRFLKISGARRFLYNWAIDICKEYYEKTGKTPSYQEISRIFTVAKKTDQNLQWLDDPMYPVTTCRYAFIDLTSAFHNFFNGTCRFPKYKSRKTDSQKFAVRSDCVNFKGENGEFVFVPGISSGKGDYIYCGNHNIPFKNCRKFTNTRVSFDGVNYWLSLSIENRTPITYVDGYIPDGDIIGIDVGVRAAATLSNGKVYGPHPDILKIRMLEKRQSTLQSACDRDVHRRIKLSESTRTKYYDIPKSKNQLKREERLAKTTHKITNKYKNYYHIISKQIVKSFPSIVVLEDLNVPSMLSKSVKGKQKKHVVHESRMGLLAEYIAYKCEENLIKVVYADRDFPSSQICSCCGNRHSVGKSKVYSCPVCGNKIDRDLNAAINLKNFGISKIFGQTATNN